MANMATIDSNFGHPDFMRDGSNGLGSGESSRSTGMLNGLYERMSGDKKTKADGQTPKRRGPKPDSKPALTRRQELNRQAQRTHRERKEMYMKALEQEVIKLRDAYKMNTSEIQALKAEIARLHALLVANGIEDIGSPSTNSGSVSGGSYGPPSTGVSMPSPGPQGPQGFYANQQPNGGDFNMPQAPATGLNYDNIGIDFVLALERPCMDHMQMLCLRSEHSNEDMSGHALMATLPPSRHLAEHPDVHYPHKIEENMNGGDLLRLLDLSNRLPLNGEITPVMAWAFIIGDPNFPYFETKDFQHIKDVLMTKVRCYGFGAVLEDFEVQDAIDDISLMRGDAFGHLGLI